MARAFGAQLVIDTRYYRNDSYGRKEILRILVGLDSDLGGCDNANATAALLSESPETLDFVAGLPCEVAYTASTQKIVLDGYWQDSRIPADEQLETLRFAFSSRVDEQGVREYSNRMESCFPVAIHVRRHDYLHHGVCDPDYYLDAARVIRQNNSRCRFFVFGDEPNFARELFDSQKLPFEIVSGNDELVDLFLISKCAAHVISNSTFSWWGARLSEAELVVAPSPWSHIHTPSPHLLPKSWVIIPEVVVSHCYSGRYHLAIERQISLTKNS